jgi:hypothetical protein
VKGVGGAREWGGSGEGAGRERGRESGERGVGRAGREQGGSRVGSREGRAGSREWGAGAGRAEREQGGRGREIHTSSRERQIRWHRWPNQLRNLFRGLREGLVPACG